jgi:hypothetical protein
MIHSPALRSVLWIPVAAIWLFSVAQRMSLESSHALELSNAAFNAGRLRDAVEGALRANGARVPGLQTTQRAIERLRAIAVGAEATGRRRAALLAWSSLAAAHNEVGRTALLDSGSPREAAQHMEGLIPAKRSDSRDNELFASRVPVVSVAAGRHSPWAPAALFLVATVLATLIVFPNERTRSAAGRVANRRFVSWLLLAAASACWCVGWAVV